MKARELIEFLETDLEAEIQIGWEEMVELSEVTTSSEDRIENLEGIFKRESNGAFVLSAESYLIGNRLYPPYTG